MIHAGEPEMKILLLVNRDVSAYYSAALMLRGHQIITHDSGVSRSENPADWMSAINQYTECDACLLVSDDPQMRGIAAWFGNSGKPVWHHLADAPGIKIRYYRLLYVLVPAFLMVVGALVIKQIPLREEAKPVAIEDQPPAAAIEPKAEDKADDAVPQADTKPDPRLDCENELRRTGDLLRSSVNRIQAGEETQSVVADMRQQEKRVSAVCPESSDR